MFSTKQSLLSKFVNLHACLETTTWHRDYGLQMSPLFPKQQLAVTLIYHYFSHILAGSSSDVFSVQRTWNLYPAQQKNRWDECSTAAKMLVECVEHYYAKRCEVVSWLFLSVTYKIKKENIKFIITQNVTNY